MSTPKLSLAPFLWPARDYHREAFNDYAESEFSKLARRVAWANGEADARAHGDASEPTSRRNS